MKAATRARMTIALLGALVAIPNATAADISLVTSEIGPGCASIEVRGEIRRGDASTIERLIRMNEENCLEGGVLPAVVFNSHGGDVREAMLIGRAIRKSNMGTAVLRDSVCISACNFAFIGGITRSVIGSFGIHRPFPVDYSVSEDAAQSGYTAIVREIGEYVEEMRVSRSLVERMIRISPSQVQFLSGEELLAMGVIGVDPVHEEVRASKEAQELGISKGEYFRRAGRVREICAGRMSLENYNTCRDRVMRSSN